MKLAMVVLADDETHEGSRRVVNALVPPRSWSKAATRSR